MRPVRLSRARYARGGIARRDATCPPRDRGRWHLAARHRRLGPSARRMPIRTLWHRSSGVQPKRDRPAVPLVWHARESSLHPVRDRRSTPCWRSRTSAAIGFVARSPPESTAIKSLHSFCPERRSSVRRAALNALLAALKEPTPTVRSHEDQIRMSDVCGRQPIVTTATFRQESFHALRESPVGVDESIQDECRPR